jgi:chemotaxis protein CheX
MLKVEHINPFIAATTRTFETMMKLKVVPGKVNLKKTQSRHWDVSGIIGLSGGAKGTVALCFPRVTALKVVSTFVGMKVVSLDKDTLDAIGELANIVAGSAKQDLESFNIAISLPSVILGDNHDLMGPADTPELVVPFTSDLGVFDLIVCFKSEN